MVNYAPEAMMGARADTETIHEAIGRLQRLTDLFAERREQLAAAVGLTGQQWRVLEGISTEHFMPSMFAREHESSPAAVSKVLRQLLDKELVVVTVSEEDGRQRKYALSPSGKRTMKRLRTLRARAIDHIWADLPADPLQRFSKFAALLVERIESYSDEE